jgi:hypothetical protein
MSTDTTILWRLRSPSHERTHAALLPGGPPFTVAFFVEQHLDRVENYETMDLALFRADDVKRSLTEDGWTDEDSG